MSGRGSLFAGQRVTRAERVTEVRRLRAAGLTTRQAAEAMGISYVYARDLVNDPSGAKVAARKASYRGTCEVCGAPTDGSNGAANAPKRCIHHHPIVERRIQARGTGAVAARVLGVLRTNGPMRRAAIAAGSGIPADNLSVLLHRLMRYGLVERVSHGVYRVAA